MKYFLILYMVVFGGFFQHTPEKIVPPKLDYYLTSKEKIRYAIFKYDKERDSYIGFDKNDKPARLSNVDFVKIERMIKYKINQHNKETNKVYGEGWFIKHPEKYFKQFIAVINPKGEKEVWVNCLCEVQTDYWKKHIPLVDDGGTCYFQLTINLTKGVVTSFGVNGLA